MPLFPYLQCRGVHCPGHRRREETDAHVRTLVVVYPDDPLHLCPGLGVRGEPHAVEPFRLQYSVDPLGYCILVGISAFGHADQYAVGLQYADILRTAILGSSV